MPLVANSDLPAFKRLKVEGETILQSDAAVHQDIRELHIGLLNMMPDAALEATERQFFRLVGESNQIAQFYMHPFTLPQLPRSDKARQHLAKYYESFDEIQASGLDALIITGANVTQPDLAMEPFWHPLQEVIDWAYDNVTSTLCSCLATHAVMQMRYSQKRKHLGFKRWGVYPHYLVDREHPLVAGVNTRFDIPHSRYNNICRQQFEAAGLKVLVESKEAGVHLAVSEDRFRLVFFQGHPEYDIISLLKEYKRDVMHYIKGERAEYPPMPENYFSLQSAAILEEHKLQVMKAVKTGKTPPELPEVLVTMRLDNTWHDTAEAVLNNWLGKVYQITNMDRRYPFQDHIDPNDPLGLKG
ncbi:homoserine O-succinyltransferase [Candidatus Tenderia electrophaga]|jgi:homoserine O-succinyltransferase|uniref:Homoserine O-succinyltransferase n=1 Tax=Candidatus Tenderia electrophaga TaxID=1748243 RepID=A0A0S2TAL9_9GAMM|nr:homoserine O-succinyltransferase [Candidatus Tenderia electrophaga]